ncbi:MAG: hypothetical protein DMF42_02735 [Verrucomicrobia bacterium]|nr:MAG: hypothetical protein DMF42_02735 [Verrucomicrobiota bacterium]
MKEKFRNWVDRLVLKTMAKESQEAQTIGRQSRISNALRTTRSITWRLSCRYENFCDKLPA